VIVLLIFGPSKLPQLGESLGRGIRNFKKAFAGEAERPPPSTTGQGGGALPEPAPRARPEAETRTGEAAPPIERK
jgi:sec-independent protein translocase protein TatA